MESNKKYTKTIISLSVILHYVHYCHFNTKKDKNIVMPHGRHIYAKSSNMEKETMCAYPQWEHALPHRKCVLICCAKCPIINIPVQESNDKYPDTSSSIIFHVYNLIVRYTKHVRLWLTNNKMCPKCQQYTALLQSTKIYTKKELVMMETTIYNFHTSFYIQAIQKLAFQIPHVQILGTNHCCDSRQTEFKRRKWFQDVLCVHDYAERVVASFPHQIQS